MEGIDRLVDITGGIEYTDPIVVRTPYGNRVIGGMATYGLRNSLMESANSDSEHMDEDNSNSDSNSDNDILEDTYSKSDITFGGAAAKEFLKLDMKSKVDHLISKYRLKDEYMKSLTSLGNQLSVNDTKYKNINDEHKLRELISKKLKTVKFAHTMDFTTPKYPQCDVELPPENDSYDALEKALAVEKLLHNHLKLVENYYGQIVSKIYEIQRSI